MEEGNFTLASIIVLKVSADSVNVFEVSPGLSEVSGVSAGSPTPLTAVRGGRSLTCS